MLVHKSMHTPEGVEEMKLRTVEVLRERIGTDKWELCTSDNVAGYPMVISTIGNGLHQGCNLATTQVIPDESVGYFRELCGDVFTWLEKNWGFGTDVVAVIEPGDFAELRGELADQYRPVQFQRVAVAVLDTDKFVDGIGWHHKMYYTRDELKNITYYQLYVCDDNGLLPWEDGYASGYAFALEDKLPPSAKTPPTAIERARQRFMH